MPVAVRNDCDSVVDLHHVNDAGHALGLGPIEAANLPANDRALLDARVDHPRQFHVDPKLGRAVHFGGRIHAGHPLPNNAEVLGVFDCNLFWNRQFGCGRRQASVGRLFTVSPNHHAVFGTQAGTVDLPFCCGRRDQHLADLSATGAQLFPAIANRGRPTRDLGAKQGIDVYRSRRRGRHLDLTQVHIQLFCDQHGQGRVDPLTHLRTCRKNGDGVVVCNMHPGVGRVDGAGGLSFSLAAWQGETHHQATREGRRGLDEVASCGFHGHDGSPQARMAAAASLMAALMRV